MPFDNTRTIFASNYKLPSKGLLYEGKIPEGNVLVAPMKTSEEKLIASIKPGSSIDPIINNILSICVDLNGFNPDQLLTGDRIFLIMAIRVVSYGDDYSFVVKCDSCGTANEFNKKIFDDFDVYELADDYVEPFELELPLSKARLGLRLLRGSDESQIETYTNQIYSQNRGKVSVDPSYTYRLARHITSISGSEKYDVVDQKSGLPLILRFLEELYARDLSALRQAVQDKDCGVSLEMNLSCQRCLANFTMLLPFTREFFRTRESNRRKHNTDAVPSI